MHRLFLLLVILLGCWLSTALPVSAEQQTLSQPWANSLQQRSQYMIAVLPMENFSVQPAITYHFRQGVMERLRAKGYSLVDRKRLDRALNALGVTHAGQLRLLEFPQLAALSGADAFLSGAVQQAAVQHAGVYNAHVYSCSLKLQNRQGEVVWAALEERIAKRRFAIDPINMVLDSFLVKANGDQAQAAAALAERLLISLPPGPAQVTVGDPLLDQAVEIQAEE